MSEAYERYEERLAAETAALRELQRREVAVRERAQAAHEEDVAGYPGRARDQRHHEVLLKMLEVIGLNFEHTSEERARAVEQAREVADLAYPKP